MKQPLTNRGLLQVALLFFGLFLLWHFLVELTAALLTITIGLLLAVALSGPVEAMRRRGISRQLGLGIIVGGGLMVSGLGSYLLLPLLVSQASQLASTLPDALAYLNDQLVEVARSRFASFLGDTISPPPVTTAALVGGALGIFGTAGSTLVGLIVAVFIALYLAAFPAPAVRWTIRLLPPTLRPRARSVLEEIRTLLLGWLLGRLVAMLIVGLLSSVALFLIGVPGALLLGIFAGVASFVPFLGPIVSLVPPVLVALAGNPTDSLWVVLAYIAIQQVEGNLLTPFVMNKAASIHPALVILAVTIFSGAFGVLGALLALPTALAAGVLIKRFWTQPMEEHFQDRQQRLEKVS